MVATARRTRQARLPRHRGGPVSDPATFSKSEMMIVAAARELAGPARLLRRGRAPEHRGQPRPADGRPRPRARLRGRRLRGAAGASAPVDRRPDHRHRRDGGRQHARAVRLLPPARARRRRLPRRRADRPVRQHQHDGDRPIRPSDDPVAGFGRRVRDRDQRPPGLRDHAPEHAQLRGDHRFPDAAPATSAEPSRPTGSAARVAGSGAARASS